MYIYLLVASISITEIREKLNTQPNFIPYINKTHRRTSGMLGGLDRCLPDVSGQPIGPKGQTIPNYSSLSSSKSLTLKIGAVVPKRRQITINLPRLTSLEAINVPKRR